MNLANDLSTANYYKDRGIRFCAKRKSVDLLHFLLKCFFIFLCANETDSEKMSQAEIILMIEKGLCLDEKVHKQNLKTISFL